jgi:hypothetical protein
MKCNPKTMLSVALALGLVGFAAYFAFPAAQTLILASAPLLVALICPISMLAMMWFMKGSGKDASCNSSGHGVRDEPKRPNLAASRPDQVS